MKTRKMLCILVVLVLLVSALPGAAALQTDQEACIRDMINDYRRNRSATSEGVLTSLQTLSTLDPEQGDAWRKIMETWDWVNDTMELNYYALPEGLPEDDSFAIVVMGYALKSDGSIEEELRRRLSVALTAAQQYPNAYVICTGGGTASKSDATEADVMAAWLAARGVDRARIIVENRSYSTAQNALNTYAILVEDYPEICSLAVVTSDYHIYRSYMDFVAVSDYSAAAYGTHTVEVVAHACSRPGYEGYESIGSQAYDIAGIAGIDLDPEEATPSASTWTGKKTTVATEPAEEAEPNWDVEPLIPGEIVFDW